MTTTANNPEAACDGVSILDVLAVWPCARAIFRHVPVRDLVRSERVSRDWQHAVHDYFQGRPLCLFDVWSEGWPCSLDGNHRTIDIRHDAYSMSMLCKNKIFEKYGPYTKKLSTNRSDVECFEIFTSNCPNLQHLEFCDLSGQLLPINQITSWKHLKQISFYNAVNITDSILGELFQNIDCENIKIIGHYGQTGSFLKSLKSQNLKSLTLNIYVTLSFTDLHSALFNLRNLTSLELNHNPESVFSNVHLLLNEMTKLENLSLRGYKFIGSVSKGFIESIGRLINLKRLDMGCNDNVSAALLEVLARRCPKLEYLDIGDVSAECARGLVALCVRLPPAITTLYLGNINNLSYDTVAAYINNKPVLQELEKLGFIELTPEWIKAASCASRKCTEWLKLTPKYTLHTGYPGRHLKIIL